MAETITKPKPVVTISANGQHGPAVARFSGVLDRTSVLSDELLSSLETGQRAAIEAVAQFLVTIEDAFPLAGTSEVAKKITESGQKMTDRLVHTQFEFLRKAIASTAKALRSHDGAELQAAR